MKLPTPEDIARELLQIDPSDRAAWFVHNTMIAAIRADREAIAKALREDVAEWGAVSDPWVREKCESIAAALEASGLAGSEK